MASLPSIELGVYEKLRRDPEFRRSFFLAESSSRIARQLIELRERRGLSQDELATRLGTKQPAISRVERADYQSWSFNTLRRLAETLDARIRVMIEPAEDVLHEYLAEETADPTKRDQNLSAWGEAPLSEQKTPVSLSAGGRTYGFEGDRQQSGHISGQRTEAEGAAISAHGVGSASQSISLSKGPIATGITIGHIDISARRI
jgi:transcriptional regulator with XRE-family HTH domain